jgi:hypothetical protein
VEDLAEPADLVLDATHVYWTDRGDDTVKSIAKEGGTIRTLASDQRRPQHPVTDETYVYWSSHLGGAIMRAPKDGSAQSAIVAAVAQPSLIAVAGQYLYLPNNGSIDRVLKSGGTPEHFVSIETAPPASPTQVLAMAVDGAALYVVGGVDPYSLPNSIWRIDLTQASSTLFLTAAQRFIADLVIDSEQVYTATGSFRINLGGVVGVEKSSGVLGAPFPQGNEPSLLALANCGVLWADQSSIYLSRRGYPVSALLAQGQIRDLVSDESSIYWTDAAGFIGKIPND